MRIINFKSALILAISVLGFAEISTAQSSIPSFTDYCGADGNAVMVLGTNSLRFGFKESVIKKSNKLGELVFSYPQEMLVLSDEKIVQVSLLGPKYQTENDAVVVTLGTVVRAEEGFVCLNLSSEVEIAEIKSKYKKQCAPFPDWSCGSGKVWNHRISSTKNKNYYQTASTGIME